MSDPAHVSGVAGNSCSAVDGVGQGAPPRTFGTPGYLDIARNFGRFGFDLVSHPVDADGLKALRRSKRRRSIRHAGASFPNV